MGGFDAADQFADDVYLGVVGDVFGPLRQQAGVNGHVARLGLVPHGDAS